MNSSLQLKSKRVKIELNIGDQLTSISCGHVVVELIKFIVYQRLQIPYSYPWLKQAINNKKMCEGEGEVKESFQSERHFRAASNALENLDFILKGLLQEISGPSIPEEVCITIGSTPVTCKEVYRLLLPTICHRPQCQSTSIASDQKIKRHVFQTLVTSDKLSQVFFSALSPTNTYIFIKKKFASNVDSVTCSDFNYTSGCRIPRNSKVVVIDFRTHNLNSVACCNDFQIFGDVVEENVQNCTEDDNDDALELESTNSMKWYQSSYVIKGLKDCIVNGSSVTNSWLSS